MSTRRRGISDHEITESIERVHKRLLALGFSEADATRGAVTLTAAFSGKFSRAQAFEAGFAATTQTPHPSHEEPT
jgi:hypothetical protein